VPTDFGISWNVPAGQPCALAQLFTATCNQATFYSLSHRYRTSIPTEQFSFQSHPTKRIDLSGRFMYSHAHMDGVYSHLWTGKTSTGRQQSILSTPKDRRDEAAADFGFRINLTDRVRLLDTARWFNWRTPAQTVITTQTWNPGSVPVTTPLVATPPTFTFFRIINKEERIENQSELEIDLTRMFGFRVGYRYTDRSLFRTDETATLSSSNEGPPASGDLESGQDRASATGNTGLAGIWFRPNEKLRISADGEITRWNIETGGGATGIPSGTTFGLGPLTRITPRREQQYRVRGNYTPRRTMVVSGSLNINQAANNMFSDSYQFHNYNGGLGVTLMPTDKYTFDLAYNYDNYLQRNFICPIGLVAGVPIGSTVTSTTCPFDNTGLYQTVGRFENVNHFVSVLARGQVMPRVMVGIGYSLVNSDGSQLYTDPLFVPGSLKNNFHRPLAVLQIQVLKELYVKGGWNYYGYNEKGPAGPTLPRDFHANSGMLSLMYAF
jgi:opacity protein-like surface antigen